MKRSVNRRTRNSAAVALLAVVSAAGLYGHAKAETAVDIASRTGEIIGAAEACGMGAGDLISVGYVVIGWAREQARSKAELDAPRPPMRPPSGAPGLASGTKAPGRVPLPPQPFETSRPKHKSQQELETVPASFLL